VSPDRPDRPAARRMAAGLLVAGLALASGPLASGGSPGTDPIATMTALAAADSADRLMNAGRYFEAIPYIARVERVAGSVDANFLLRAASAESNAGFQARAVRGLAIPVTRSSIERTELMSRSFQRFDLAEAKSVGLDQRSTVIASRAHQLAVWGFAREGYAEYRRAHQVHALDVATLRDVRWLELALRPAAAGGASR